MNTIDMTIRNHSDDRLDLESNGPFISFTLKKKKDGTLCNFLSVVFGEMISIYDNVYVVAGDKKGTIIVKSPDCEIDDIINITNDDDDIVNAMYLAGHIKERPSWIRCGDENTSV